MRSDLRKKISNIRFPIRTSKPISNSPSYKEDLAEKPFMYHSLKKKKETTRGTIMSRGANQSSNRNNNF
jgi:hypothetical protein